MATAARGAIDQRQVALSNLVGDLGNHRLMPRDIGTNALSIGAGFVNSATEGSKLIETVYDSNSTSLEVAKATHGFATSTTGLMTDALQIAGNKTASRINPYVAVYCAATSDIPQIVSTASEGVMLTVDRHAALSTIENTIEDANQRNSQISNLRMVISRDLNPFIVLCYMGQRAPDYQRIYLP
jgi:hypothetical protein